MTKKCHFSIIVNPLDEPRRFGGKQWQICLNLKKEREKRKYVKIKNGRAGRAENAKINVFVH